jgi:cytoskeletal protein RodZ
MEDNISVGTLLKNAREKKKLKIEDLASKTKININILKALENNEIDKLPNIAYLKGFVKNYAKAVDVELTQAQKCLENTLQIKEKVNPAPIKAQAFETKTISEELDEQELKENMISFVQSFFNKKIMLGIIVTAIAFGVIKTIVNWIAELNFESSNITDVEKEVKKPKSLPAPSNEPDKPAVAIKVEPPAIKPEVSKNQPPAILKDADANILQMDGNKKFAKAVLAENKKAEVKKIEVKKAEPKLVEVKKADPKKVETKKVEAVKIEKKKEKKKIVAIRTDGKFPYRVFDKAPLKTFSVDAKSPLNSDTEILPSNFKAAVEKDKENILIHATDDDMWLSYKSDDNPIKRFVLRKGRKVLIKGKLIQLFLGNYRVAKLFYNNQLMNIKPTKSGVRSIIVPQKISSEYKLPLFPVYKGKSYTAREYIQNMADENSEKKVAE